MGVEDRIQEGSSGYFGYQEGLNFGCSAALVRRICGFLDENYSRTFVIAFDDIWSNPLTYAILD